MEYMLFMILAPIVAAILAATFPFLLRYWKDGIGRALILYLAMIIFLLLGNIMELAADSESLTFFWARAQHLFWSLACVFWLVFCLIYSGLRSKIISNLTFWLFALALLFNLIVQTTARHCLYYSEYSFFRVAGYLTIKAEYGPLFWIAGTYHYILLISGAILLVRSYVKTYQTYRTQSRWVVLGGLFPIVFNILYIFRVMPFLRKDFTPLAFAFAGLVFFWGVYHKKLLYIVPVARNLVVQDLPAAILVLDKYWRIVDFNLSASLLFLLEETDLGSGFNDHPKIVEMWEGIPEGMMPLYPENFRREMDERVFDIKLQTLTGSRDTDERGVLVTIIDMTDSIRLAREKEKLLDKLTAAQSELIRKEKMATMGLLSAGLAHEINNPLSFIKSHCTFMGQTVEKLKSDTDPEIVINRLNEMQLVLKEASEGFARINGVVGNLLRFARGNGNDTREVFNINQTIEETIRLSRSLLVKEIDISISLNPVPLVSGYPGEIGQVILNLLTNAVSAARQGQPPPRLVIRTRTEEGYAVLEVLNSGNPIPLENRKLIFEPFFTTKKAGEGTGLGLSIVQDIVDKHRGRISLGENDGMICFSLFFPGEESL